MRSTVPGYLTVEPVIVNWTYGFDSTPHGAKTIIRAPGQYGLPEREHLAGIGYLETLYFVKQSEAKTNQRSQGKMSIGFTVAMSEKPYLRASQLRGRKGVERALREFRQHFIAEEAHEHGHFEVIYHCEAKPNTARERYLALRTVRYFDESIDEVHVPAVKPLLAQAIARMKWEV